MLAVVLSCCASCARRQRADATLDPKLARAAQETYARIAHAMYDDSLRAAQALLAAVDALLAEPSPDALESARAAWLAAREPYAQSEVFRFSDGPIDRVELLINTWPIDENVVEAPPGSAERGMIDAADEYPALSPELLARVNMQDGETSVTTGYHVIEFLLWGRDLSVTGPGARPFHDFVPRDDSPLVLRRRHYVRAATELLVRHLAQVRDSWAPAADNYRAAFLALPAQEAIALMIKSAGTLSGPELAGERLTVPYETRDQENEHSCFSDSTHRDLALNAQGVESICLGRYTRTSGERVAGSGLCAALATYDGPTAALLETQVARSVQAARALPQPFDRALVEPDGTPGRAAITRAIQALEAQTVTLGRAAASLRVGVADVAIGPLR